MDAAPTEAAAGGQPTTRRWVLLIVFADVKTAARGRLLPPGPPGRADANRGHAQDDGTKDVRPWTEEGCVAAVPTPHPLPRRARSGRGGELQVAGGDGAARR